MFRIGVVESALACVVLLLSFTIPLMIARINIRLKNIEKKLDKK